MNSKIFPNNIVGNIINERLSYSQACPRFVRIPVHHGQSMATKACEVQHWQYRIAYSGKINGLDRKSKVHQSVSSICFIKSL